MRRGLKRFLADPSGATSLEYGLIISLIFLVILASFQAFAGAGTGVFNGAMNALSSVIG